MFSFFQRHQKAFKFIKDLIFKKHKGYFGLVMISTIVSSGMAVTIPYLSKLELDQLSQRNTQIFGMNLEDPFIIFGMILGAIFLMEIIEQTISFLFSRQTKIRKEIMDLELKREIYFRLYNIDPGYTIMNRFRRMMGSVRTTINSIPNDVQTIVSGYLGSVLELFAVGIVASFFDWKIFLIIFIASFLNYGINRLSEYYQRKHELSNEYELDWEMHTIEHSIEDSYHHIASNGAITMLFDRYFGLKKQQIESTKKKENINFLSQIGEKISNGMSSIVVKLLVGSMIFAGTQSLGLMVMATMYMGRINRITDQFFRAFSDRYDIIENIGILEFFLDFISEKSSERNISYLSNPSNITLSNVSFAYPKAAQAEISFLDIKINTLKRISATNQENYYLDDIHMYEETRKESLKDNPTILDNLTLSFEKGKLYGIVGKNGAGKSTLTSLLLGFFSEYKGSIQIDHIEFSTIQRGHIQKLVSYISQEPFIMYGKFTIRDNITLGVERDISDEEIYRYLDLFGLKEKIKKEREGLNTRLRWDMDLSGGQKQILVLIRIILQDRPILILDEGTNQLDAENEMKVMNELLKSREEKIIIFVTHRMNTMKKCDWIYTIVDGQIEDTGIPGELAIRNNAFSKFIAIGEQAF